MSRVVTFGCRLNAFESEVIKSLTRGEDGTIIVNTCAVTAEAERQARQAIRKLRRENPDARIVVTGCAAQIDPASYAAMPEIDRVIGNAEKLDARSYAGAERLAVGDIMIARDTAEHLIAGFGTRARAIVQAQNGCDHRCTFCIIPFGRGPSRSVALGALARQVRALAEDGVREVVISGVDLTSWGEDLPGKPGLGQMVRRLLAAVPELERLRLSSFDVAEADEDLLRAIAEEPRLMPHFHLSLQSGDDMILKRMKRRHSRADAIAFCASVRRLRPDVAFGGDIIAGFPTETEDMFRRSLDLIDECGLTQLHVFPFSPRPGTSAERMPQVAGDVIKDRARRLRGKGEAALRRYLDGEVGARRRVLTERGGLARTPQFTPVRLTAPVEPGVILDIAVASHNGRQLLAA